MSGFSQAPYLPKEGFALIGGEGNKAGFALISGDGNKVVFAMIGGEGNPENVSDTHSSVSSLLAVRYL
jgi:hypothetical protein